MRKVYKSNLSKVSGPYSQGVDSGEYVYLSGQTARNSIEAGAKAKSIAEQTEECFKLLFDVLKNAGLDSDDVVKVNVYLTSMKYFEEMNEVYKKQFSDPYPARTCVAVLELPLGADVEIELVAKKS